MGLFDLFRKKSVKDTENISEEITAPQPEWHPTIELDADAYALPKTITGFVVGETNYINSINIFNNYNLKARMLCGNVVIDKQFSSLGIVWQSFQLKYVDNVVSQIQYSVTNKSSLVAQEAFEKVKNFLMETFKDFDISFSGNDSIFIRNHYAKCKENISYHLQIMECLGDYYVTFNVDIFTKDIIESPSNISFSIEEEKSILDNVFGVGVIEEELAHAEQREIRRKEQEALYKTNGITDPINYVGVRCKTHYIQIFTTDKKIRIGNSFYLINEIKGCQIVDNPIITKGKTTFKTVTKSSTGNAVKRAVIGGVIAGGVGTIIGGATAKSQSTTTASSEPDSIRHDYTVIITLSNFTQIEIKFGDKMIEASKFVNLIESNL